MTNHAPWRGLAALLLVSFALCGVLPADALAKGKGKGKGKGKSADYGLVSVKGGHGGKPDKSGRGHGNADKGHGASHGNGGRWDGRWTAEGLAAAGFGTAALYDALGGDRALLSTGAKPLPPGIQKNLARGKPLPPGMAMRDASPALAATLPRVDGHEWKEVGRDLVLVTAGTLVVKEILEGVLN